MEFSLQKPAEELNAKYCALETKTLFSSGRKHSYQLYKIILETGRKHQIRAIFSFFQAPVIGDKKYGSQTDLKDKIFLFAYQLEFNNLPSPLTYLNQKTFAINRLEDRLIK